MSTPALVGYDYSKAFLAAFAALMVHEVGSAPDGGYNVTKGDAGGATKWGISLRFLQGLGRAWDKDRDGDVDAADIRALSIEDARLIYLAHFWRPIRGDELPPPLALLVFDAAVHSGPLTAIRWLQRAVGVLEDGRFGPITLAKVLATPDACERFHTTRAIALTDMKDWATFSRGWARRIARLPFQAMRLA